MSIAGVGTPPSAGPPRLEAFLSCGPLIAHRQAVKTAFPFLAIRGMGRTNFAGKPGVLCGGGHLSGALNMGEPDAM